jgi:hypothetical protein
MKDETFYRCMRWLAAALLLICFAGIATAQTPPTVTFGASVTNAAGSLTTTLTWSTTPAATSCTASGHTSWTGTKAASGTQTLPAITLSGTYSLTLNCTWPGDNTTTITWIAPTQNTDGSALSKCPTGTTSGTCLAGFRLYRRVNSTDFTGAEMTQVDDPNATSKLFTGLVVGTHNFVAEAFNANGTASDLSAVTSRVIAASVTRSAGVTLTVNPKPNPPVLQ